MTHSLERETAYRILHADLMKLPETLARTRQDYLLMLERIIDLLEVNEMEAAQ